jgi:hypothetical protein
MEMAGPRPLVHYLNRSFEWPMFVGRVPAEVAINMGQPPLPVTALGIMP